MLVNEVDQNDLVMRMQAMELQTHELREQIAKLENSNKQKEVPKLKLPSVAISGVFQEDAVAFNQDDASREAYGRVESGADFRRARLEAKGAVMQNITLGLNWYVNPYCKCVANYIHTWAESRPIRNGSIQCNQFIASETDA
jgi:phosphate-selective porin